jgi:hypothetical protein
MIVLLKIYGAKNKNNTFSPTAHKIIFFVNALGGWKSRIILNYEKEDKNIIVI